jgi:hypothetical protein
MTDLSCPMSQIENHRHPVEMKLTFCTGRMRGWALSGISMLHSVLMAYGSRGVTDIYGMENL